METGWTIVINLSDGASYATFVEVFRTIEAAMSGLCVCQPESAPGWEWEMREG